MFTDAPFSITCFLVWNGRLGRVNNLSILKNDFGGMTRRLYRQQLLAVYDAADKLGK